MSYKTKKWIKVALLSLASLAAGFLLWMVLIAMSGATGTALI